MSLELRPQAESTSCNIDRLLTVHDLEQLLQVDKRTIARLTKRGILPVPLKLGGGNRWRCREVIDMIDRLDHQAEARKAN